MSPMGVRLRAVGGSSPRIGAVHPEFCSIPPSPNGGHGPLRPDDFGGGTETSVSLHREPRPSIASLLRLASLAIEIFAKCADCHAQRNVPEILNSLVPAIGVGRHSAAA